ncbi:hypothetical protein AM1_1989 [Acaryochloris marina MBIC11017]|uniref:Uncharacterized protein n=2 Tax=Acaryochloris marina TaxID=155978 RepID=B0CFI7_ACAM1|nr:hypothetical protein [Acaryochloris marina]ABW27006.1 hypothetical protein AM1_1989 [Acaryochloris marina MBIC11017]
MLDNSDVMLFHRVTGCPIAQGKFYLQNLSFEKRFKMIDALQVAHQSGTSELHDPLEDDPDLQPIFEDVRLQARQEVDREHRQRMIELQNTSPKAADLCHPGRGLCHQQWLVMKRILREKYGIEWMTPAEMNPFIVFD